jgi:methylthioribose-1-phosphate isomerase
LKGGELVDAIRWKGTHLELLDQRLLPHKEVWICAKTCTEVAAAIEKMVVRGAPAIAIAAAYGLALAVKQKVDRRSAMERLLSSRPTAVNLRWAMQRLAPLADEVIESEAMAIHREDITINQAIGSNGAALLKGGVLTICNTGSLATGGHGTALGMIRSANIQGRDIHVYAMETRPYLQGARLTAFECLKENIPCSLITDGMAGALLQSGQVNSAVVGCDRVARNGDCANKIGTYGLAVLCRAHGIPFYVAMPWSTYDLECLSGDEIPIEHRPPDELRRINGSLIAPQDIPVWNPAFDCTPFSLITAWITETGIIEDNRQLCQNEIY